MIFQSIFRLHNYAFSASYHKKFQQVKYCQYNLQQPQGTACFLSAGLRSGHFDSILSIGLTESSKSPASIARSNKQWVGLACIRRGTSPS